MNNGIWKRKKTSEVYKESSHETDWRSSFVELIQLFCFASVMSIPIWSSSYDVPAPLGEVTYWRLYNRNEFG
jgi:hypothetical protein